MIMNRSDHALAIRALRSAAPYIRMYKGKTFVVKAGGGVCADVDSTRLLIEQLAILHYFGVRVVMVHGGGPQLTELSESLGLPTQIVHGRRVTDAKSIEVTAMVLPAPTALRTAPVLVLTPVAPMTMMLWVSPRAVTLFRVTLPALVTVKV